MMYLIVVLLLVLQPAFSYHVRPCRQSRLMAKLQSTAPTCASAAFTDIMPYLAEHVEKSDQVLFLGCKTDLSVQLCKAGWGTEATGFIKVVDNDEAALSECRDKALADPEVKKWVDAGKLSFQVADLTSMADICQQSVFDAIVDYGGLDSVLNGAQGREGMLKTIDHLQNAVRLGNILVCLSGEEKSRFCAPFEERFGWVQELDGDPGDLSMWIRGKSNIASTKNNFKELGIYMYVYTNVDNC